MEHVQKGILNYAAFAKWMNGMRYSGKLFIVELYEIESERLMVDIRLGNVGLPSKSGGSDNNEIMVAISISINEQRALFR